MRFWSPTEGVHNQVAVPGCLPVSILVSDCYHGSIPPTDLNQDRFADRGSFASQSRGRGARGYLGWSRFGYVSGGRLGAPYPQECKRAHAARGGQCSGRTERRLRAVDAHVRTAAAAVALFVQKGGLDQKSPFETMAKRYCLPPLKCAWRSEFGRTERRLRAVDGSRQDGGGGSRLVRAEGRAGSEIAVRDYGKTLRSAPR